MNHAQSSLGSIQPTSSQVRYPIGTGKEGKAFSDATADAIKDIINTRPRYSAYVHPSAMPSLLAQHNLPVLSTHTLQAGMLRMANDGHIRRVGRYYTSKAFTPESKLWGIDMSLPINSMPLLALCQIDGHIHVEDLTALMELITDRPWTRNVVAVTLSKAIKAGLPISRGGQGSGIYWWNTHLAENWRKTRTDC